jgi:hypothetical protein
MARFILNRPSEKCPTSELEVAQFLAQLGDDWLIRWGFHYEDGQGMTREGDFLVLGPHGGLLVLEVKAGDLDPYAGTGIWGTASGDNPMFQLDAQWKAVVNKVNDHREGRPSLRVERALGLPSAAIDPKLEDYHTIPRRHIIDRAQLNAFTQAWDNVFAANRRYLDGRSREIFMDTYGKDADSKSVRHFMDQTDDVLVRMTRDKFLLLDQLDGNRQFMVEGGVGSGKTWLAFELARRWAAEGEGQTVLFLCYNLALARFLKKLVDNARRRDAVSRGRIEVKGWEELARGVLEEAGLGYDVPEGGYDELNHFYTETVPELLAEATRDGAIRPAYDALVVDEGQDHDTSFALPPEGFTDPGWWGAYFRMLRAGAKSPIAIFYDTAQRPDFRAENAFDPSALTACLGGQSVQVCLPRTVRYTRPIFEFLKQLDSPRLKDLVAGLKRMGTLPTGPEVETLTTSADEAVDVVSRIIRRWLDEGHCLAEDVMVLSARSRREDGILRGCEHLAGLPLKDYLEGGIARISTTSANKAKGLESRAVILVDFPPRDQLAGSRDELGFFMGASRARQLLAVVCTKPDFEAE